MNFQEDLLIHGDSVYDIIDKQDHQAVQSEMSRPPTAAGHDDTRIFLCRMNVSRNARRQMRFGDQKVIINKILLQSIIRTVFISSKAGAKRNFTLAKKKTTNIRYSDQYNDD